MKKWIILAILLLFAYGCTEGSVACFDDNICSPEEAFGQCIDCAPDFVAQDISAQFDGNTIVAVACTTEQTKNLYQTVNAQWKVVSGNQEQTEEKWINFSLENLTFDYDEFITDNRLSQYAEITFDQRYDQCLYQEFEVANSNDQYEVSFNINYLDIVLEKDTTNNFVSVILNEKDNICTGTEKNRNTKGTSVFNDVSYTDSCDGKTLTEYYCENNQLKTITEECSISCTNGACTTPISPNTQPPAANTGGGRSGGGGSNYGGYYQATQIFTLEELIRGVEFSLRPNNQARFELTEDLNYIFKFIKGNSTTADYTWGQATLSKSTGSINLGRSTIKDTLVPQNPELTIRLNVVSPVESKWFAQINSLSNPITTKPIPPPTRPTNPTQPPEPQEEESEEPKGFPWIWVIIILILLGIIGVILYILNAKGIITLTSQPKMENKTDLKQQFNPSNQ